MDNHFGHGLARVQTSFTVEFLTVNRRHHLSFQNVERSDIEEFFGLFGTVVDNKIHTEAIQRASDDIKARVGDFCDRRRDRFPQMGALKKLIGSLSDGEAFVVVPAAQRTPMEDAILESLVEWGNGNTTEQEIGEFFKLFGPILDKYRIVNPCTDRPAQVGNAQLALRRCRFCGGTKASGSTFKSRAHAISFALGNTHLKLADECDNCNGYFGKELEPHLLALTEIERVFLGIRGRGNNGGLPKVRIRGGTLRHDGQRMIVEVMKDALTRSDDGFAVELDSEIQIVPERCYRTLAKFALSVVPEPELPHLEATVNWVRHGVRPEGLKLPLVYQNLVALPPNPSAQIVLYVRQSAESDLPHVVGEFRLGCYMSVFMLPFSKRDTVAPAFMGAEAFNTVFQHYAATTGWRPVNFDDLEPLTSPGVLRVRSVDKIRE